MAKILGLPEDSSVEAITAAIQRTQADVLTAHDEFMRIHHASAVRRIRVGTVAVDEHGGPG